MNSNADKADFEFVGTIGNWFADRAGKVIRFSLRVRGLDREKILDLKYFGSIPAFAKGDRVRVVGDVGSEKLPGVTETGKNGRVYDKWVPLLAARRVESISKAQATLPGANDNAHPQRREDDDIPF